MKHPLIITVTKAIAAAALMLGAPLASASDVSWSVTIGSPYPAPHVYSPPPRVIYVQPQPVYVRPQPVYVYSDPVYYSEPYYVEEGRHRKYRHGHHGKRHHDRDDD